MKPWQAILYLPTVAALSDSPPSAWLQTLSTDPSQRGMVFDAMEQAVKPRRMP